MSEQKDQNEAACGGSALTAELGADFGNAEERYLREMIAMLHESYTKAAKPYFDRLAMIYALRPAPRMFVSKEMYEAKNG
ncbi:MAG: hypothetical protein B7Z31_00250 [Rhodobacterales bacterium 12-65-15]|nr:MAG: hypothetical protein B7Z31_00250 [Rhodobacterales bacterium 12-65-15]